jgi:hypothetical protein
VTTITPAITGPATFTSSSATPSRLYAVCRTSRSSTSALHSVRIITPSGGAQAPAAAARTAIAASFTPERAEITAMAIRMAAKPAAIGGRARRGPCRSTIQARNGDTSTMVRPNSAITSPANPYWRPPAVGNGTIRRQHGHGIDAAIGRGYRSTHRRGTRM